MRISDWSSDVCSSDLRLAGDGGQIGPDIAVGDSRQLIQIDIFGQRHRAGVNAQNLAASGLVGNADDDLPVETAGTTQRLVQRLRAIGRGDDHKILSPLQPRSEEPTSALQSLMRISNSFFCLKTKT